MQGSITELAMATLFFCAGHFLISSTPLRGWLVGRLGEKIYLGLFSLYALASFSWMLLAYGRAPYFHLWVVADLVRSVVILLMVPAVVLLFASLRPDNPSFRLGSENAGEGMAQGIFTVTRHPMFWGTAIWAGCHMLANGDLASQIFFGGFLVLSLGGTVALDAKFKNADPDGWLAMQKQSSNLPFAAILGGRVSFDWTSLRWSVFYGLAAYVAFLNLHQWMFGVSPFPIG